MVGVVWIVYFLFDVKCMVVLLLDSRVVMFCMWCGNCFMLLVVFDLCSSWVIIGLLLGVWLRLRLMWFGVMVLSVVNCLVMMSGVWLGSMILLEFRCRCVVWVVVVVISMGGVVEVIVGMLWCLVN